jgi:hypothetical protein
MNNSGVRELQASHRKQRFQPDHLNPHFRSGREAYVVAFAASFARGCSENLIVTYPSIHRMNTCVALRSYRGDEVTDVRETAGLHADCCLS